MKDSIKGTVEMYRQEGGWAMRVYVPQWVILNVIRNGLSNHPERITGMGGSLTNGRWDGLQFFIRDQPPEQEAIETSIFSEAEEELIKKNDSDFREWLHRQNNTPPSPRVG